MKKVAYIIVFLLILQVPCFARDFIVEFLDENYQETQTSFSYAPIIYHSIQVRTLAGPKLLVLTGDDYHYRKWLREYIAEDKSFIAKVPEDQNELFITSSAFEIDVTNLHPLNLSKYKQGEEKSKDGLSQLELDNLRSQAASKRKLANETVKKKSDQKPEQDRLLKQKNANLKNKKVTEQEKKAKLETEKKRLEQEKQIQALNQLRSEEELKLQKELDEQKKIQQAFIASLAQQRAENERERRAELDKRWLELKQRLLEDDSIRGMDQETRNREIERRWLELKARYNL